MAKQTFTTGQVLTAAQMTSLQQTAMLGGSASAKTASYTLVAADAGTAITMSNASATTITVNTALFASGDTVQITNIGAGVCTITAGTATVNTASSLALAQYESGTLTFTATSAAIFIKGDGAAAASGGMTLISTTTFNNTVTTYTVSSIAQTFKHLLLVGSGLQTSNSSTDTVFFRFNGDTGSNYSFSCNQTANVAPGLTTSQSIQTLLGDKLFGGSNTFANMALTADGSSRFGSFTLNIYDYTATNYKALDFVGGSFSAGNGWNAVGRGLWNNTAAITSITFASNVAANLQAGIIRLYGVS